MPTPATVEIWESNGTSGAEVHTKVTSFSLGSGDVPNLVASNYPLVIPAAGTVHSYQKETRWKLISWVDTNTVDTLRWYKSAGGALPTGWTHRANATIGGIAYFTPDTAGTNLNTSAWPTSDGTSIPITGTISTPTTGYIDATNYAVHAVDITSSTVAGSKGVHTISWVYNES